MPIDDKDLITWSIGATAALFAGVGVFLQVRRERRERRLRLEEEDRLWSIDRLEGYDRDDWIAFQLIFRDPHAQPIRLESLKVLRPRGAVLADLEIDTDFTNGERIERTVVTARGKTLKVARDLSGYIPGRGPQATAHWIFHIDEASLKRSAWRGVATARIAATVSDRSRTRRKRTICITTDEITVDSTKNPSVM